MTCAAIVTDQAPGAPENTVGFTFLKPSDTWIQKKNQSKMMFHKKLYVCLKASDGSSSRDDLPALLLRRNDQIRRLEAKLSGRRRKPASVVSRASFTFRF